jgi:fatty-acid peroxygenase
MKPNILTLKQSLNIPADLCLDNTLNLLLEGYLFIPNRIRKHHEDLFQTRLLCQKVICMSGKKAAELFYDQNLFTRRGAIPKRIQETLFGKQSIQTLSGAAHMHRKQLFLSIMNPDNVKRLIDLTGKQWEVSSRRFEGKKQIILFDEAARLLFQAACKWAGVPVCNSEIRQKAMDMSAMVDAFGAVGIRHFEGRCARNRCEIWASQIIQDVRSGRLIAPTDSALSAIAWYKDLKGKLLCSQVAAVELINILRPITAIATYITFGALALHTYPKIKEELQKKDVEYLTMFVQEVRRFYPFGPFLGARVRVNFKWMDHYFKKGTLVLMDIYGTNHDPAIWQAPNVFLPEHFKDRSVGPIDFIPQGGGDYKATRCPGEILTIELMKVSMDYLANHLDYEVPLQDLSYSLCRMPAIPKSRFLMRKITKKPPQTAAP